jgi:hypothetical protein
MPRATLRMPPMKLKASMLATLTALVAAAIAIPAHAAAPTIRYTGAITGLPPSSSGSPVVTLDVVKKKGKIVSIQGGGFAGLTMTCPAAVNTPPAPIEFLLVEPIKVTNERFKATQKISTLTVTISGRFTAAGAKASGTVTATAVGIEISSTGVPTEATCTTGSHPWNVAKGAH